MSKNGLRPNALISFVLGIIYAAFYDYIVRDYIFTVFDYYVGYKCFPMDLSSFVMYLLVCAAPLLLYQGVQHFSGAMSFIIYLLAYVPIIHSLYVAGYPFHLTQGYIEVLFVSMILIFLSDGIILGKKLINHSRKRLPFKYLEVITLVLLGLVLVMNRNQLHFVNILSETDI